MGQSPASKPPHAEGGEAATEPVQAVAAATHSLTQVLSILHAPEVPELQSSCLCGQLASSQQNAQTPGELRRAGICDR